jgi:small conductance mechanosensitive channel
MFYGDTQLNSTLNQSGSVLKQISDTFFNTRSILVLLFALIVAMIIGRLLAAVLRRVTKIISKRADATRDLTLVNRLRRSETLIVLSIALIRMILVIIAIYFWWTYTHPHEQPTALLGASAVLALVLGGVMSPLLRDFAFGGVMMAEHWFGVGDHVTIEPYTLQGVIERVTLRSTRIRSLSGEVIWISNQNIGAVRVAPKGIQAMALEIFVSDLQRGLELIDEANLRIPIGPLMVVNPLAIMTQEKVGPRLWHLTAVAETAPERSWLLETFAIKVIKEVDETSKMPILVQDPVVRFADSEAERRFARIIHNSRKTKTERRTIRETIRDKHEK